MAEPAWTTSTLTKEVKARMWLNTVGIRNPGALQTSLRPPHTHPAPSDCKFRNDFKTQSFCR